MIVGSTPFLNNNTQIHKVETMISDSIYKHIHLHPFCKQIIDTPQFQRLRFLRQLGVASWVYPSATHSRFEHSIGVSHLANRFIRTLQINQPELQITETEILCVTVAGLCHDLGHGPYSHLFDNEFIRSDKWSHEKGSVNMLKHLVHENNIQSDPHELQFIYDLILCHSQNQKRRFLYEIINNDRSGLDVDKLDYLVRDAYMTGVGGISVDVERIIQTARVMPDEHGSLTICFPVKCVDTIFTIFHARMAMHTAVYQHKTVKAIEYMIRDILQLANDYLIFSNLRMSETIHDMNVYQKLNDSVLYLIEQSTDPRMKPAQDLLQRLYRRDLYKYCGTIHHHEMMNDFTYEPDVIVENMIIHHGKGPVLNPLDNIRFFNHKTFEIIPIQYPETLIPKAMGVQYKRIFVKYARDKERIVEKLSKKF